MGPCLFGVVLFLKVSPLHIVSLLSSTWDTSSKWSICFKWQPFSGVFISVTVCPSVWLIIKASYLIQMCIYTRSKHTENEVTVTYLSHIGLWKMATGFQSWKNHGIFSLQKSWNPASCFNLDLFDLRFMLHWLGVYLFICQMPNELWSTRTYVLLQYNRLESNWAARLDPGEQ